MSGAGGEAQPTAGGWRERLLAGERLTLARAITEVENDTDQARKVLSEIHGLPGRALVVGITGAPGVGKSTLLSAYVTELRRRGRRVGVVAIDPSSPISGGAILGDRIRMAAHAGDQGVFVRSLASRGHLGGLSRTAALVVDLMDAAGMELILVETVGAGQSEVEIAGIAHTKIVVVAPGMGDEIQAVKAGLLEIADIMAVNKGELPQAELTASQLRDALGLTPRQGWQPPVLLTVATTGEGVAGLADAVEAHATQLTPEQRREGPRLRIRRLIASAAADMVRRRIGALETPRRRIGAQESPRRRIGEPETSRSQSGALETPRPQSGAPAGEQLEQICEAVQRGEINLETAAERAVAAVWNNFKGK